MGYDVIGDIHGQATKLKSLLSGLGYVEHAGGWLPPQGCQAIFVGDLVDRGPEQLEVVRTVRAMVDGGHARCVLGNHELNAIGYATRRRDGGKDFLREHSAKNAGQHKQFLQQIGEGSPKHLELIEWFRTLAPVLDLGGIRVVHAWWHQPHVDLVTARVGSDGRMDDDFIHDMFDRSTPLWAAMEGLTKGLELELPEGHSFQDHGGVIRREVRARWWLQAPQSYRDVAIVSGLHGQPVTDRQLPPDYLGAPVRGTPVFIGHYWMTGEPVPMSPKVACVDWSAADGGPLVAYRWDGEDEIDPSHFFAKH